MIAEGGLPATQSRQLAMLVHLAGLANFMFGFAGLIVSIVIFSTSSQDKFVRDNARQAANMQITFSIWMGVFLTGYFVSFFTNFFRMSSHVTQHGSHTMSQSDITFFIVAFGMMGLMMLGMIVTAIFSVIASVAANKGRVYYYPIAIRFLRTPQA